MSTIVNKSSGNIIKRIKISVSLKIKKNISNIRQRQPRIVISNKCGLFFILFKFWNLIFNISINKKIDTVIEINESKNNIVLFI